MRSNLVSLAQSQKTMFRNSILLNVLLLFLRGMPFGFVLLVLGEMFSPKLNKEKVVIYIACLFAMLILNLVVAVKAQTQLFVTSYRISCDLRLKLGEHLRKLSLGFFKKKDPGDITAPLLQDMKNLETIFSKLYPNIIASIILPAITVTFLALIDLRLTAVIMAFVILSVPVLFLGNKLMNRLGKKVIALRTTASSQIIEYFLGMKVLRVHNLKGEKFKRLDLTMNNLRKESIRLEAFVAPLLFAYMVVLELGFIVTLVAGTSFLLKNTITAPMLLLFLVTANGFLEILQGLGVFIIEMRYMNAATDRITDVLQAEPLTEPASDSELTRFEIDFLDVTFSYHNKQVLKGVSFTAKEKNLTALVGTSGSGKTTVTNLISRFWDVDSGEIRIGGTNVKDLKSEHLLSYISTIFQDVFLFNDSVYNNIKIGKQNASYEEVIEAAKAAQCHEIILKLPQGYETVVGEGGSKLSGGERQRISIARAILKDASIILLDEATASLDPENERHIQAALNKLISSKTLIVIAHRLSTIQHADQIIVLDDGRVTEKGKHHELLARDGLYRRLWEKQQESHGWVLEPGKQNKQILKIVN